MSSKDDYIELVEKAQLGDKESMNLLAELARERLRSYVYRMTLRDDLAQDIVQESMLEMFKVLGKLKRADRFWPWIYTITYNKVRRHWRTEKRHKAVCIEEMEFSDKSSGNQGGLENLVTKELKQVVMSAMKQLKTNHRAVLTMRCYDNMKYSEIAVLMGSSELGVRMLFLRAKKSLAKQLSRRGLSRGVLLTALVTFGKLTAPSEAAAAQISVSAASIKVGLTASTLGYATSKVAVLTLATAGVVAIGTTVVVPNAEPVNHVAYQEVVSEAGLLPGQSVPAPAGSVEDRWYYYPKGSERSLMMRQMVSDGKRRNEYCQWLQDDNANYYYDREENVIYINNFRTWDSDLSVPVLPTDKPDIIAFLSQVQVISPDIRQVTSKEDGLLVITTRDDSLGVSNLLSTRHPNVLQEDYFKYAWPANTTVIDNRDAVHRQGWSFVNIEGHIRDMKLSGSARVPFFYETSKTHSPWLKLSVETADGTIKIVDTDSGSVIVDGNRDIVASYKGGYFFRGLSRQWQGLHTIDIVRRDAVKKGLFFETAYTPGQRKATVSVPCDNLTIVYTIDMEKDVIDTITFQKKVNGVEGFIGELNFTYIEEAGMETSKFSEPRIRSARRRMRKSSGVVWLARLADGSLAE